MGYLLLYCRCTAGGAIAVLCSGCLFQVAGAGGVIGLRLCFLLSDRSGRGELDFACLARENWSVYALFHPDVYLRASSLEEGGRLEMGELACVSIAHLHHCVSHSKPTMGSTRSLVDLFNVEGHPEI